LGILDPLSLVINTVMGDTLTTARRYDEAIAQLTRELGKLRDAGLAHTVAMLSGRARGHSL